MLFSAGQEIDLEQKLLEVAFTEDKLDAVRKTAQTLGPSAVKALIEATKEGLVGRSTLYRMYCAVQEAVALKEVIYSLCEHFTPHVKL